MHIKLSKKKKKKKKCMRIKDSTKHVFKFNFPHSWDMLSSVSLKKKNGIYQKKNFSIKLYIFLLHSILLVLLKVQKL